MMLYKVLNDFPVIIAQNRDELTTRKPGKPPLILSKDPIVIAPQDTDASGTWMGFNQYGVVNSLTNVEQKFLKPDAKSRGLLVLGGLQQKDAGSLQNYTISELESNTYNYFNLLFADKDSAQMLRYQDDREIQRVLKNGLHILPSSQINDTNNPTRRRDRLNQLYHTDEPKTVEAVIDRIKTMCRDHYGEPNGSIESICVHTDKFNTVSSTIIAVNKDLEKSIIHHAQGSPCKNSYQDYSIILKDLKPQHL